MKTSLPQVLSDYYTAVNDGRTDDAAACFTADALVHDASQDRQGQEAIRAWIAETTQKYHPQVEIIGIQEAGGALVATGRVSGAFPGSPVQLEYSFKVNGGKISHLVIQ
jgi:hypothetical protein